MNGPWVIWSVQTPFNTNFSEVRDRLEHGSFKCLGKPNRNARQEGPCSSKPMTVWILVQSKEQAKPRANERDMQRIIYFHVYNPKKVSKVAYRYLKYAMKKCTAFTYRTQSLEATRATPCFSDFLWLAWSLKVPQKSRLRHEEKLINICAQRFRTKLHKVKILLTNTPQKCNLRNHIGTCISRVAFHPNKSADRFPACC